MARDVEIPYLTGREVGAASRATKLGLMMFDYLQRHNIPRIRATEHPAFKLAKLFVQTLPRYIPAVAIVWIAWWLAA